LGKNPCLLEKSFIDKKSLTFGKKLSFGNKTLPIFLHNTLFLPGKEYLTLGKNTLLLGKNSLTPEIPYF
jgi:hypothetical protein